MSTALQGPDAIPTGALSDSELVRLCLQHDQDAWAMLLERYGRLIFSVAYRAGADTDLAEEVFQSVSTTLAERLHLIEDPERLPKWLIVTTRRRCQELSRARGRVVDPPEDTADETDSAEEHLLREEARCKVAGALAQLSERDRDVLCDLFVRNLSYADVAKRHGLAIGSLGSLRARALRRLRSNLKNEGWS